MDLKATLLFGGKSFEHEISIVSSITVMSKLTSFDLNFVFCDDNHEFYLIDKKDMKASYFSSYKYKKAPKLQLSNDGFSASKLFSKQNFKYPVINMIHGGDGEDATIASLLEFYGFEYLGPRRDASIFSIDKRYTKYLAQALGVNTLDYEVIRDRDFSISYPCIIKPASLGSSIGVSIIKEASQKEYALDVAYEFDESVIVEPFIEGVKEYNLAGCKVDGEFVFSIVEEPKKEEFLDFNKKYLDFSRSSTLLKADISQELEKKLQDTFVKIYDGLFDGAIIRCDFFVIDDEVYLNEINPIPGSLANYLFEDFESIVAGVLNSLPHKRDIKVNYQYINQINQAKGK
jgi:D-alanine-D-alanine ligase